MLNEFAKKNGIKYFLISYTDYFGIQRSKLVPTSAIEGMSKSGAGFAGFASYLDLSPQDADMFAVPDASSVIQLPWKKDVAWVSSYLKLGADNYTVGARDTLKKVQDFGVQNLSLEFKTGVECEFFLLDESGEGLSDKKDTLAKPCYDQLALMRRYDLISRICDYMNEMGWEPYQNDHEDAQGQFEMNWGYANAMVTADRHSFFKFMVKTLAEDAGYKATFMAKPFSRLTGNGCHTHISAWDKNNTNVFSDKDGQLGLTQLAYYFIGGVLSNANGLTAFTNPTVNSFKRINSSPPESGATWAPNTISYGGNDRTHLIRIPDDDRIEVRLPDGSANPYLLQASLIVAGISGIVNKVDPGSIQNRENCDRTKLPRLPTTLAEALGKLRESEIFRDFMGSDFVDSYIKIKSLELNEYNNYVSGWERSKYLHL